MNDVVIVDAGQLQSFFFKYDFHNRCEKAVRENLLEYIPLACNYKFDIATLVAEVDVVHTTQRDLSAHMSFRFCPGCKIHLSSDFYELLKFLGRIQGVLLGWKKCRARPKPLRSDEERNTWLLCLPRNWFSSS